LDKAVARFLGAISHLGVSGATLHEAIEQQLRAEPIAGQSA
jgi:Fe-S cluster biogenesis protein NfuA